MLNVGFHDIIGTNIGKVDIFFYMFRFLGTPFFHSMVARAQASNSDISVLMDSETILLPDFFSTLSYVHKLDHDWLLIASSRNVSDFPFQLDVEGKKWLGDNGERIKMKKVGK